jgi:hypothetical protein
MIKDAKMKELEDKNQELKKLFEEQHTEKMEKLNKKIIGIVSFIFIL